MGADRIDVGGVIGGKIRILVFYQPAERTVEALIVFIYQTKVVHTF